MLILSSKLLSKWCKEKPSLAQANAHATSEKTWHGRSPAATLQDLINVVVEAYKLNTDITYGIGGGKNQMYYFFVGTENDVLNKLGIK